MAMLLEPRIASSILKAVDDENSVEERVWVQIFEVEYKFQTKLWSRFSPSTWNNLRQYMLTLMAVSDVEAILEFLKKNGFSEAKSAFKANMGSFDWEKLLLPMVPCSLWSEFSPFPTGQRLLPALVIAPNRALFLERVNLLGWDLLLLIFSLHVLLHSVGLNWKFEMLTCIACSKQLNNGSLHPPEEEDAATRTPRTKQAIKNHTAQIKDIALKASTVYKNCKSCSRSSNDHWKWNCADSDASLESARFQCWYRRTGSSNSPRQWGKEIEVRLKGLSSGKGTSTSVSGRIELVVFM